MLSSLHYHPSVRRKPRLGNLIASLGRSEDVRILVELSQRTEQPSSLLHIPNRERAGIIESRQALAIRARAYPGCVQCKVALRETSVQRNGLAQRLPRYRIEAPHFDPVGRN